MPRGSGDASAVAVRDLHVAQAALASDSDQVVLQQRRSMRRIKSRRFLKRVELILQHERQLAQQAELIWRGYDDQPAGFGDARQLAYERARIFQVLDGLDGNGHMSRRVFDRPARRIE